MTLPTYSLHFYPLFLCFYSTFPEAPLICSNLQTCSSTAGDTFLNALFNQLRWKYQTCHSSAALRERLSWRRRPRDGGRGPNAARLNTADLICMLFIGGWITQTAYEPVRLAVVAMDTGPLVLSFSLSCEWDSPTLEMRVFSDVQWNIVLQRRAAAVRHRGYPTGGDCADPDPHSLIWAGGNNVHWPVSINPSRCQPPHLLLLQG